MTQHLAQSIGGIKSQMGYLRGDVGELKRLVDTLEKRLAQSEKRAHEMRDAWLSMIPIFCLTYGIGYLCK